MNLDVVPHLSIGWAFAATVLVLLGAAVQVAVGAGLSVVCGAFLLLTLGASLAVPVLLVLNFLVSVAATAAAPRRIAWWDVLLVSLTALVGSVIAAILPALPVALVEPVTACALIVIAIRRPPTGGSADRSPSLLPVGLGGFISGVLTVWTATPGPVVPAMLGQAGRSGDAIRRTMQPISIVGYGIGIACIGTAGVGSAFRWSGLPLLSTGVLAGCAAGLYLRRHVPSGLVVMTVRGIAAVAAAILLGSWVVQIIVVERVRPDAKPLQTTLSDNRIFKASP